MKPGKTLGVVGLLAASSLAMAGCCWFDPDAPECRTDCFLQPEQTVALNCTLDATARPGVYANEDLEWKGAFVFNKTTRMLTLDGSWLGPYAGLWDDGPWGEPTCGHEPVGSVAGDNKFGITAFMAIPSSDVTIGTSAGPIVVPANSSTPITVDCGTLPAPGTTDLKLMLDTNNLGSGFTYAPGQPVVLKGSMSYWMEDLAYDDGSHGDTTASDGVFTSTWFELESGTHATFLWTINNVGYTTDGGTCEVTGVSAMTNKADAGWVDAPLDGCGVWIP